MKKILIIAFILISIIGAYGQAMAFDINEVNLYKKSDCGNLLKYQNITRRISYVVYQKDGKEYPAYCLNSELPGAENGSYDVSTTEKLNNNKVWKVIINGFPYRSVEELGAANEEEAFAATKQAVYWALYDRNENDYSAYNSEAGRRTFNIFKDIVNRAKNCNLNETGVINLGIEPLKAAWKVDEKDTKCVSKNYRVNCNIPDGSYEIKLQGLLPEGTKLTNINNEEQSNFKVGEEFKILMPIKNITQSETFTINAIANVKTYPVLYGKTYDSSKQNYAITGLTYEQQNTSITEDYAKNRTKIIVHKQEYGTKTPLQGVKFQLLDENKNVIMDNLVTDGKGEITLENMVPGKYFLKETKTLDGYNLYTDYIELGLDLNEEIQVIVNNTKRTVEEINKNYEVIEIVSDKEEKKITEDSKNTQIVKNEIYTEEIQKNTHKYNEKNESLKYEYTENNTIKKLTKTGC